MDSSIISIIIVLITMVDFYGIAVIISNIYCPNSEII